MDIKRKLEEYRNYIVLFGIIVGALSILNFLPAELPVAGKDYTNYVYVAIMALAGYTFYEFHWNTRRTVQIRRTVPSRNISSPEFRREVARQRGDIEPQRRPPTPAPAGPTGQPKPSKEVWETFNRD